MRVLVLAVAVLVAGCGGTGTPTLTPSPALQGFGLAAVRANFADECRDPIIFDELLCEQIKLDQMTSAGNILTVPTTLHAAATDRASAICDQIARAHYDGATGRDLGYEIVGILDKDGGNAAACYTR